MISGPDLITWWWCIDIAESRELWKYFRSSMPKAKCPYPQNISWSNQSDSTFVCHSHAAEHLGKCYSSINLLRLCSEGSQLRSHHVQPFRSVGVSGTTPKAVLKVNSNFKFTFGKHHKIPGNWICPSFSLLPFNNITAFLQQQVDRSTTTKFSIFSTSRWRPASL